MKQEVDFDKHESFKGHVCYFQIGNRRIKCGRWWIDIHQEKIDLNGFEDVAGRLSWDGLFLPDDITRSLLLNKTMPINAVFVVDEYTEITGSIMVYLPKYGQCVLDNTLPFKGYGPILISTDIIEEGDTHE